MKKIYALVLTAAMFSLSAYGQTKKTGLQLKTEALKQNTASETVEYIVKNISSAATDADTRSLYFFAGTVQEQQGKYAAASGLYAKAAGIGAADAEGFSKVTNEELVLCAVRCALCAGDTETADSFLSSSVRNSKDQNITALVNLYTVWSALCKTQSIDETKNCTDLLKAYSGMKSMAGVKPQVLFTLWYVNADSDAASKLKKEFPDSTEEKIVEGTVQMAASPFWLFVPHKELSTEAASNSQSDEAKIAEIKAQESKAAEKENKTGQKITRQQCGLFRSQANASELAGRLKAKGFNAEITEETRASGTTYYIVVVRENEQGNMGLKLRDAGFECYPVVE